jgi:unsaturated chondroitin disaccharide hydrolase
MNNHFRPDHTSYHVVVYDRETGKKIKGVTHQGYADNSMRARGKSRAIYGYMMIYRETKDPKLLDFTQKISDAYLEHLPNDLTPYGDSVRQIFQTRPEMRQRLLLRCRPCWNCQYS